MLGGKRISGMVVKDCCDFCGGCWRFFEGFLLLLYILTVLGRVRRLL